MPANTWQIGTFYIQPNGPNGYWHQPGGPGTPVIPPLQVQANSELLSIEPFTEKTGVYIFGCGHSVNRAQIYTDWDYETEMTVALIACPMCSFVQRIIEPASDALGPGIAASLINSILYP